jgi:hypothetical protein
MCTLLFYLVEANCTTFHVSYIELNGYRVRGCLLIHSKCRDRRGQWFFFKQYWYVHVAHRSCVGIAYDQSFCESCILKSDTMTRVRKTHLKLYSF